MSEEKQGRREAIDRMTRQIRESNPRTSYDEARKKAQEAAIRYDRREERGK